MSRAYRSRQLANLAFAVNAVRPVPGMPASVPTFFSGWLTSELAPHLIVGTAADTAWHLTRHGRGSDRVGLAAATAATLALGTSVAAGRGAADEMHDALVDALGPHYDDRIPEPLPLRKLALPFRLKHPDVVRLRNIAYAQGGKRFRLDVYRHRDTRPDSPMLLQIHGGGWAISNKDHQGIPLMTELASRGWVCAAINYPLSPRSKWPEHLIAAKRAIAWLREHAAEYGGSPDFIAVTGGSAGGHIAAMAALTPNEPSLQPGFAAADTSVHACVPMYAPYDIAGETGLRSVRLRVESAMMPLVFGRDRQSYLAASPYAQVRADAPPFFVVHGSNDSLVPVPEARAFVQRLRSVSTRPVAYAELRGGQHAFDVFTSIRSMHVVRGVAQFLEWARVSPNPERRADAGPAA